MSRDLGYPVMKTVSSLSDPQIASRFVRNVGEQCSQCRTAECTIPPQHFCPVRPLDRLAMGRGEGVTGNDGDIAA
jgi:hypothetical protein